MRNDNEIQVAGRALLVFPRQAAERKKEQEEVAAIEEHKEGRGEG